MSRKRSKKRAASPQATPETQAKRGFLIAFLILCGIGAALSLDLIRVHVNVHTNPDYVSYCSMGEALDCEAVAASEHSVFGGLPIAVWGLLGYLVAAAWAWWGSRSSARDATWPWGILFGIAVAYTVIGLRMFWVSHFVIGSICLVCAGTYLVNLGLAVVAFLELRRRQHGALSALFRELGVALSQPIVPLAFVAAVFGAVLILQASITPYWTIQMEGPGGLTVGETADGLHWIGAAVPEIDIIEYSDYQCPHCLRGHNAIRDLVRQHPDRVRLVHRHYPLDQACNPKITRAFHVFACSYSRLAYCAGKQGQFWEANDYIFQQGRRTDRMTAAELARQLGLDAGELTACESSRDAIREVEHDMKAGRDVGVRGTPTFVMNGTVYSGGIPPEAIADALGQPAPAPATSPSN